MEFCLGEIQILKDFKIYKKGVRIIFCPRIKSGNLGLPIHIREQQPHTGISTMQPMDAIERLVSVYTMNGQVLDLKDEDGK